VACEAATAWKDRPVPTAPTGPARRTLLALAVTAPALVATAGCGALLPGERRTPRPPTPDELAVERAAADATRLRAAALALATQRGAPATVLRRIAADHTEHLEALGAVPLPGEVTPPPSAAATPVPRDVRGQRDAEWNAARAALRDALTANGGLATLLVRIAAARAVHADVVASGRTGAPPPRLDPAGPVASGASGSTAPATTGGTATETATDLGTAAREALGRLLAGEYAAVFAYPAIVARCASGRRSTAEGLWRAHVGERDELERLLEAEGADDPPAAAPAYDIGEPPPDSASAAKLAATVENRLTALSVAAVAPTAGDDRLLAARRAVTSARRSGFWGGAPGALPG
jgi:hypothetical protein